MKDPVAVENDQPIDAPAEAEAEAAAATPARPRRARRARSGTQRAIASYPLRNVGTIAGRELYSLFASPIAYLVIAFFLVMNGYLFSVILISSRQASMTSAFSDMAIVLIFVAPAITMRLLSEEQRNGTIELLLTSPLRESELVLGKWLGALGLYAVMLLLTLPYPLFLAKYGQPDSGAIFGGYVGTVLLGGVCLAIGLLVSSWTQNQIVALAGTIAILLVLWLLQGAGQSFATGAVGSVVSYIALSPHFDSFTSGAIQLKDLIYYTSLILIALFLAVRSIETRRWR
ncbi:MAG: ABC transporter permease subunit [Chloroflexi bacterium]|nr:ABC transporter permease subunit [Chloroflexota bacterium]